MVPTEPQVAGISFPVQYVVESDEHIEDFVSPVFRGLRYVSGPSLYNGEKHLSTHTIQVKNIVYTLTAERPGRFTIPGITIQAHGKIFRSATAQVEVVSAQPAIRGGLVPPYVLLPGEDPDKKIAENFFVRVAVDRKACFIGEPIVATFKLYSRLQSRTEIIKNPAFYGFSSYDMVTVNDRQKTVEQISGNIFDVHVLRKVQLFPVQSGLFTIDAMELDNEIEFARSVVFSKPEQEVFENNPNRSNTDPNIRVVSKQLSTEPVVIHVKSLPDPKPGFNGAVGKFKVTTSLNTKEVEAGRESIFSVIVSGKGNMTQINPPQILWPAGIEIFDPEVKDTFSKQVHLSGTREFHYKIIAAKPGTYQFPEVEFISFDPSDKKYHTSTSDELKLEVLRAVSVKPEENIFEEKVARKKGWIVFGIAALILAGAFIFYMRGRKPKKAVIDHKPTAIEKLQLLGASRRSWTSSQHKQVNLILRTYLAEKLGLPAGTQSKNKIAELLFKKVGADLAAETMQVLAITELYTYSGIASENDNIKLYDAAVDVISRLDKA